MAFKPVFKGGKLRSQRPRVLIVADNSYFPHILPLRTSTTNVVTATISENTGATYSGFTTTYIKENAPTTNFSTSNPQGVFSWASGDTGVLFGLVSGLSNIPSNATIVSAKIRLRVNNILNSSSVALELHELLVTPTLSQTTWNVYSTGNNWNTAGCLGDGTDRVAADLATITVVTANIGNYVEISSASLTTLTQAIVSGTKTNRGFINEYVNRSAWDSTVVDFDSHNAIDGRRPEFVVTYTVPSGGAYSITAQAGSYSLTGQSSTLLRSKLLTATTGTFTYSGVSAGLNKGRVLTATNGAYSYTGVTATILKSKYVISSVGAYTYSGISANISRSKRLVATNGAYTLSGQSATLTYTPTATNYTLTALAGAYTYTGQNVTVLKSKYLLSSTGAYVFTGVSANLLRAKRITANAGSYALTGQSAVLTKTTVGAYTLTAQTGSYVLNGQNAILTATENQQYSGGWNSWDIPDRKRYQLEAESVRAKIVEDKKEVKRIKRILDKPKQDNTEALRTYKALLELNIRQNKQAYNDIISKVSALQRNAAFETAKNAKLLEIASIDLAAQEYLLELERLEQEALIEQQRQAQEEADIVFVMALLAA